MGGSRSFDLGGLRIEKARDDGRKVALDSLKSWPIGGPWPCAPPLKPPLHKNEEDKARPNEQSIDLNSGMIEKISNMIFDLKLFR